MARKQVRGPVRDRKKGLSGPDEKRVGALLSKTIDYLESELDMLLSSPGCHKEVLAIAKGLEAIRASQSGGAGPPSIRSEFDLGADAPGE